jgi:hypothetical protein
MSEIYGELKAATPEELLAAVQLEWKAAGVMTEDFYRGLKLGFKLASPGGWEAVAPAWLRTMRELRSI